MEQGLFEYILPSERSGKITIDFEPKKSKLMSSFAIVGGIVAVLMGIHKFMESGGLKMLKETGKNFREEVKENPVKARNKWVWADYPFYSFVSCDYYNTFFDEFLNILSENIGFWITRVRR